MGTAAAPRAHRRPKDGAISTSTPTTAPRRSRRAPAVPTVPVRCGTHLIVVAALAASLVYIVWRWGFTLDGPVDVARRSARRRRDLRPASCSALLAFSCWRLARREVPPPLEGREVAVLIATFNEPEDVLRPTVVGAMAIRNDVEPRRSGCSTTGAAPGCA